jgi:homoserine O-acetyltransferase/O-succinyltransferase
MEFKTEGFYYKEKFALAGNRSINAFHLRYTTYGNLNKNKDNVIWVFHALTGNSVIHEWWSGLIGENKIFDPKKYFIICVNNPGSCYGSISPLDKNSATNRAYYRSFPFFTIKDVVNTFEILRQHLQIKKIKIGIGGSMGGQQLLQWAVNKPTLFEHIIPIATNARHSAWGIAINASQRMAIEADATWKNKNNDAGKKGLAVARSIAMLSYRHWDIYNANQTEKEFTKIEDYKSDSYQRYQGEKLANRFNAFSYYFLTKTMDSHSLGKNKIAIIKALNKIKSKTLVISIATDLLFTPNEQKFIAHNIPNAIVKNIHSIYGHDAFLVEYKQLEKIITPFLKN